MKYELAKELKDAGFPQSSDDNGTLRKGGAYLFPDGFSLSEPRKKFDAVISYAPTLSELIDACGEKITGFTCRAWTGGKWQAFNGDEVGGAMGDGPTPEEAVARLFLALYEKTK